MKKIIGKIESERDTLSWVDLSEEELLDITDISVCMYGKQDNDSIK